MVNIGWVNRWSEKTVAGVKGGNSYVWNLKLKFFFLKKKIIIIIIIITYGRNWNGKYLRTSFGDKTLKELHEKSMALFKKHNYLIWYRHASSCVTSKAL